MFFIGLGIFLFICMSLYIYKINLNIESNKVAYSNTLEKNEEDYLTGYDQLETNSLSEEKVKVKKEEPPQKNHFMSEVKFNSIMEKGAKNNGVVYMPLSELDPMTRKEVEKVLNNLKEKGSLSGGVRQQEFSEIEKARETLREEGIEKIVSALDGFKGVNDSILNAYDLNLTGAQAYGRYDTDNGWNSLYKLYENTNQKIEIEQSYLKPNEAAHQFITESLNIELDNKTPARYEKLPSDLIEKVTFVHNSNYYQINGQNLKSDQLINIANKIINSQ